jgi:hypothetical protein
MPFQPYVLVSPSANPIGDIGSEYPPNVYDSNRFSLPMLRQNDVYDVY